MDLGEERGSRGRQRKLILPPKSEIELNPTQIFEENEYESDLKSRDVSNDKGTQENRSVSRKYFSVPQDNPKNRVVLNAVELFKQTENRLSRCKSNQDFLNVGRDRGRVEGMIEGYIMAMFNVGMDLDEVSGKLVLTFNLTQQRAEGFLKEFYEKRNITFEEK